MRLRTALEKIRVSGLAYEEQEAALGMSCIAAPVFAGGTTVAALSVAVPRSRWNPIVVDETTWEPSTHRGISTWGHLPVGRTIVDKLDQERTVPALSGAGIPDD